jgi:hypothetical protein
LWATLGPTRGRRRPRLSPTSPTSGRQPSKSRDLLPASLCVPAPTSLLDLCPFACTELPRQCQKVARTPQARRRLGARPRKRRWRSRWQSRRLTWRARPVGLERRRCPRRTRPGLVPFSPPRMKVATSAPSPAADAKPAGGRGGRCTGGGRPAPAPLRWHHVGGGGRRRPP